MDVFKNQLPEYHPPWYQTEQPDIRKRWKSSTMRFWSVCGSAEFSCSYSHGWVSSVYGTGAIRCNSRYSTSEKNHEAFNLGRSEPELRCKIGRLVTRIDVVWVELWKVGNKDFILMQTISLQISISVEAWKWNANIGQYYGWRSAKNEIGSFFF